MNEILAPGIRLLELINEHDIGQIILSQDTGISTKTINSILRGRCGISAENAVLIAKYFPVHPAEYWLELDYKWRLAKAQSSVKKHTIEVPKFKAHQD